MVWLKYDYTRVLFEFKFQFSISGENERVKCLKLLFQYAPYKTGGKGTLAERARKLGLDQPAKQILNRPGFDINMSQYFNKDVEGMFI